MDHQLQYPKFKKQQTERKKRLSQDQLRILEANFNSKNKLDPDRKSQLALELGVPPRQVAIWYQNKRAREKNQSLEASHEALQLQLESVSSDNARLKAEVERLQAELNRIQAMVGSFASPGDEVGSSNLIYRHDFERELRPSLVGGGGGLFAAQDGCGFFGSSIS